MRRMGTAAASLSVVAGLIVGAMFVTGAWAPDPIPPSQERNEREVVVTREDPSLPEGCGVRETTERLLSFMEGFSQGDLAAADEAFSETDSFFYVGIADPHGLTGEATVDRAGVMAYLESRAERTESYRLTNVMLDAEIDPRDPQARAGVRVHFVATRRADDIHGQRAFRGWAQLDCPAGDIYLMELWPLHPSEDIESWCSASDLDEGEGAVIACSPEPGGKKSLIFPVMDLNPGEEAGLGGRLVRRGRCLYVRSGESAELGFPLWPPGFTYDVDGGVVTVRDGTGAPVARTGSRVTMAGGYHGEKPVGVPLLTLKDEWEPCTVPASYYFTVSYVVDDEDPDQ